MPQFLINIWLKLFRENFNARCDAYINSLKDMFMQKNQDVKIALTLKQRVQKIMTNIGGGWYMEKIAKGLPALRMINRRWANNS